MKTTERIVAVAGMVGHPSHGGRMEGLEEKRP